MTKSPPPQDATKLKSFIKTEYHAKLRAQLRDLAELSDKVEAGHDGQADVPARLVELLHRMTGELKVHMMKEELVLFPAIRNATARLDRPIVAMRADHEDHWAVIEQIRHLTNGLTLPAGACRSCRWLYAGMGESFDDLQARISLEKEVLPSHIEA